MATEISLRGHWNQPAWLLQAWCSRCMDPLQPIAVAVSGPDSNAFLPVGPGFSPFCGSQKAAWTYLLKSEAARQPSVRQTRNRNSNWITGHAALGSIAQRLVVFHVAPSGTSVHSSSSQVIFLGGYSNHTLGPTVEIGTVYRYKKNNVSPSKTPIL